MGLVNYMRRHFRFSKGIKVGRSRVNLAYIHFHSNWFKRLTLGNQRRVSRFDRLGSRMQQFGKLG